MTLSVLFIDNFDSFSFNLVDEFRRRGARVDVWRNDLGAREALAAALALPAPRLIVLSPGPGNPREAGCCLDLIRLAAGRVPLFGVCLGHQAIVEAFGGTVGPAGDIVHGKCSRVSHEGGPLFAGLPSVISVGRYHSLAAHSLPQDLRVTARMVGEPMPAADSLIMAVEHVRHPVWGVQFHPESILTPQGGILLENLMAWASSFSNSEKESQP